MSLYDTLKIYDSDRKSNLEFDRNKYLQQIVKRKKVLHVGCTDFPITQQKLKEHNLLHEKLEHSAKEIVGIDISEQGVGILHRHGFKNIFQMDAENITLSSKFDIILAGDVIEHMNNPGLFLDKVKLLLNHDGELIIGVPSALTFNNIKAWFLGREQVHCDHTFYFSPKTLSAITARFDLLPTKLIFTVQPQGNYESSVFVILRKIILKLCRTMAPSIIMHFKKDGEVDKSTHFEWK